MMREGPDGYNEQFSHPLAGGRSVTVERRRLRQRVRHWERDGSVLGELVIPVTSCGCAIEALVVSPSGRWLVTTRFSGQGEWGYDVIDLDAYERTGGVDERRGFVLDAPRFSDDEHRLVGGYGEAWLGGWWAHPEDEPEEPARGGRVTFGWIFDHHLRDGAVSWHELVIDVPAGWLPDDIEDEVWCAARDIAPLGAGVAMTLPGGARIEHPEPLPEKWLLPAPR